MKEQYRLQQLSEMTGIEIPKLQRYEQDESALSSDEKIELKKAKRELSNKKLILIYVLLFFFGTIVIASGSVILALTPLSGNDYVLISIIGISEIIVGLILVIFTICAISIVLFKKHK